MDEQTAVERAKAFIISTGHTILAQDEQVIGDSVGFWHLGACEKLVDG